jgi:hypothetical protein
MSHFVPGLDLCESFFQDIAQPILDNLYPSLQYSAGLIGYGSEVLGYDDITSTDHNWGPRFMLFLPEGQVELLQPQIENAFATRIPYQYRGFSTHFGAPDMADGGTRCAETIDHGKVSPLIQYFTPTSFFLDYLGYDLHKEISIPQWLTISENRLLGVTSGRMFRDDLGIQQLRMRFAYYPDNVWLWLMASQWKQLAEEEPFVGRTGMVGDDIGSRLVAARQVQRLMRLGFLQERRYAPYSKWFGTAFTKLDIAPTLQPILECILTAAEWTERQILLARAYTLLAEKHNTLGVTPPLRTSTEPFFGRPIPVLFAQRFAGALREKIQDPALANFPLIGSVSQFTDSVTLYDDVGRYDRLMKLYE